MAGGLTDRQPLPSVVELDRLDSRVLWRRDLAIDETVILMTPLVYPY